MKCFFNPKGKSKSKGIYKSAPELNQGENSEKSAKKSGFRPSNSLPSRSIPELYKEKEQNLRVFSLQELVDATNGFSRMLKIGEGGFGSVYKGRIKPTTANGEPVVVAIKKLNQHSLQVNLPSSSFFLSHIILNSLDTFLLSEFFGVDLGMQYFISNVINHILMFINILIICLYRTKQLIINLADFLFHLMSDAFLDLC